MKSLIAVLMLVSLSAHAKPVKLNFTHSADSVQAVLYDVLYEYKVKMDSISTFELEGIKRVGSKLIVSEGSDQVVCDGRTLGMAAVMSYACEFGNSVYPWNMSSNSVPASLYNALADSTDQRIVKGSQGELILQDERTRLECNAGSPGVLTVLQYTCSVGTH